MKLYTSFVLVFVLVGTVLGHKDKKEKEEWRLKKEKHHRQMMEKKDSYVGGNVEENSTDYQKGDMENPIEYKGGLTKTHKLKHYFGKKKFYKKKSKKHHSGKKAKKAHAKAMKWLDIRSDMDCDLKCKAGEVCISGPVVKKPICVHKKDLKKSMKMFHRYHRKEMKDWRKFQKKHYKTDWKMTEEKYGKKKLNKEERIALKKQKLEKLGKKSNIDEKFPKKDKDHFKPEFIHKSKGTECDTSRMSQMQNRMTGWFHLLHGQDKEARKAHKGSIAKFYKHVSVKKELREINGEKCQCMKSAMWQFHQMDKDQDDHVTRTELTVLEENSLEPCMRPYLDSCDRDGDSRISSDEWCCCFTNVLPPCYRELNDIRREGKQSSYMPRCDKEGYFMREQCKGDHSKDTLTCWCVDYNGNEYEGSAKKGRAHCHKIAKYAVKDKIPLA